MKAVATRRRQARPTRFPYRLSIASRARVLHRQQLEHSAHHQYNNSREKCTSLSPHLVLSQLSYRVHNASESLDRRKLTLLALTTDCSTFDKDPRPLSFVMAVLFQVPGLEVDIVDDQKRPLYEYEDEEDAQTPSEAEEEQRTYEMTRYIESKSGAKFGIRHSYSETFGAEYGIRLEICVDGCIARKLIVPPTDLYTDDGQHVCSFKYEHRDSKRLRRDFQFADLEVGEYAVLVVLNRVNPCR